MNEIEERVAKAIYETDGDDDWDTAHEGVRGACRKEARAAIKAMQMPAPEKNQIVTELDSFIELLEKADLVMILVGGRKVGLDEAHTEDLIAGLKKLRQP